MKYLNLDKKEVEKVVKQLDILLADYNIYYQKLRNFHWNVVGRNFFDLHDQFEDMYNDAKEKVDEIAERILTLRYQPTSNFSDYLKKSNLEEAPSEMDDKAMVKALLEDHGKLLEQMKKIIKAAEAAGDDGTDDLIGAYIGELEKTSWMLDAWTMDKNDTHRVI